MTLKVEEFIKMQDDFLLLINICRKVIEFFSDEKDVALRNWIIGDFIIKFREKWGKNPARGLIENLAQSIEVSNDFINKCIQFREAYPGFRKHDVSWSYFKYGLMLLKGNKRNQLFKEIKQGKYKNQSEVMKRTQELKDVKVKRKTRKTS